MPDVEFFDAFVYQVVRLVQELRSAEEARGAAAARAASAESERDAIRVRIDEMVKVCRPKKCPSN